MRKTLVLTEGAVFLAIFAVLLLITTYIPVLGTVTTFFLALPFMMYGAKYSRKNALLFLVAAILISLITGTFISIPLTFLYGITGFIMGECIKREKDRIVLLLSGSISFFVILVCSYYISVLLFNEDYIKQMLDLFKTTITDNEALLKSLAQGQGEKAIENLKKSLDLMYMIIPFAFIGGSVLNTAVTQAVSVPIIRRFGITVKKWEPLRNWRMPKFVFWTFLIVFIVPLVLPLAEGSIAYICFLNAIYLLQMLVIVQGISFVFYFSYIKKFPKAVPIIIVVFALINPFLLSILRIIGLVDIGFNLRRYKE